MSSEVARRKRPAVAVYECYEGEGKHCAPRFPEHSLSPHYSLNENSDHPVSLTGSFLDSFTKWTKCLNHCIKLCFWIQPALWHAATEPGGALSRSSAFMFLLGNTRRWGTYVTVAFMQVTIVASEFLSAEDKDTLCLPLREITLHTLCWMTDPFCHSWISYWERH